MKKSIFSILSQTLIITIFVTGCGAASSTTSSSVSSIENSADSSDDAGKDLNALRGNNVVAAEEDEELSDTEAAEPIEVVYDELQEFYVSFPIDSTLTEAVEFLEAYGLPYTNETYNGSRQIQVSTEQAGTAQKYNKSGLSYITIDYRYASGENSKNDDWEKYHFSTISYVPIEGYFAFQYASPGKGIIKRLGTDIKQDLSREEQIEFFYQYKDDKNAFK